MNKKEKQIIKNCQAGRLECFDGIYQIYFDKVYKYVFFKTFHRETAEDIVSQVFIKALENIEKFDFSKGEFSGWLFTIARNQITDFYRTAKKHNNVDDIWDLASSEDVFAGVENKVKIDQVKKYLSGLKSFQRDLIIMRVWQGLSYREISEITGKSPESLKTAFSRQLAKLNLDLAAKIVMAGIFLIKA